MHANINAYNIAIVQAIFGAGNTMADNIIDGCADRSGKGRYSRVALGSGQSAIAFVAWYSSLTTNKLFSNFVNFGSRLRMTIIYNPYIYHSSARLSALPFSHIQGGMHPGVLLYIIARTQVYGRLRRE